MTTQPINPTLRAAIKLRHLSDALRSDWSLIDQAKQRMDEKLKQAEELAAHQGDAAFRTEFDGQLVQLRSAQRQVVDLLRNATDMLKTGASPEVNWPHM